MNAFLPTIILRHRKENIKKCSLKGLEARQDLIFHTYPLKDFAYLPNYQVLSIDGPILSAEDSLQGLLLVDSTWAYSAPMLKTLDHYGFVEKRSLPNHFRTAYPRKQTACTDPERGLASIEALFIAFIILGKDPSGLLDRYHWKEEFIEKNLEFLSHYKSFQKFQAVNERSGAIK